ncbi:hypothetical protein F2S72_08635 [Pseudomonas syringae pv. actinidiae]|nr:hypothetical protein [Pseudomonas syringae pv. actinidiae]
MNDLSPSEFLRREVYPRLDAVAEHLLDSLEPKQRLTSGSYPLICPECKAKEGFYFPNNPYINCPRKNECGKSTSIWDAMLYCGYEHGEIFSTLCKAAGVTPPKRDHSSGTTQSPAVVETRIGKAIWQITQKMAADHSSVLKSFQDERGYTSEQMSAMRLGYYTTAEEVLSKLKTLGFSKEEAVGRGYVEVDKKGSLLTGLAGRVIGYWQHPDGEDRLWGRIPTGSGDEEVKKYKFALHSKKDIPYLYSNRKRGLLVCVEGTMDAWALQHADIWGVAVGGAQINGAQALYMQGRGVTELAHMVDGDQAGWNGALASIRNCEPLNIVVSVIALGAGMDDADALLRSGKADVLRTLVNKRMNAGRYMALMLRQLYNVASPDIQAVNRIYALADSLTPTSRIVFDKYAELLGVRLDLRLEAGRLFSNLLAAGLGMDEAIANVRRRTGHVITIAKETTDA